MYSPKLAHYSIHVTLKSPSDRRGSKVTLFEVEITVLYVRDSVYCRILQFVVKERRGEPKRNYRWRALPGLG